MCCDDGGNVPGFKISTRRRLDPEFWLVWKLVILVVIAGYLMNTHFENAFRSVEVIGWTTLGFGILLFLADKLNMTIGAWTI